MFKADRRIVLQSFTLGAGALATSQSFAATPDGHAAGYDVSPALRVAVAELSPGECAYIPKNCGHSIKNVGSEDAEIVGVPEKDVANFSKKRLTISAPA